jgi:hypothetical protein
MPNPSSAGSSLRQKWSSEMHAHWLVRSALVVACVTCGPWKAQADPVQIGLEIAIGSTFGDFRDIFGVPIDVGDVLRGTLTYDSSTPDRTSDPLYGDYRGGAGSLTLDVGSGLTLPLETVYVVDQAFDPIPGRDDAFGAIAFTESFSGFDAIFATVDFRGAGREGDDLPLSAADLLAAFSMGGFRLSAWQTGGNPPFDSGTHELSGIVRLVGEAGAPVPEPATLLLLTAGAVALRCRQRKARLQNG